MRPLSIAGMFLIVLGVLALMVRSVTYFSTDTEVGPLGFFTWDVTRPHTLFISPMAGVLALVLGIVLAMLARNPHRT